MPGIADKLTPPEAARMVGDRLLRGHWMFAGRQFPAARGQPFVQRLEVGKAGQRGEQLFADVANLILDLALLPA